MKELASRLLNLKVNHEGVAIATLDLIGFSHTEGEILSFASPKESIQRKGDPDVASTLRFSHLSGVARKYIPVHLAKCGIHAAPLTGYSRQMLRCSARHTGVRVLL